MTTTFDTFDTFAADAAAEVSALRAKCHLGTPQAPSIAEIEAIVTGDRIAGLKIAAVADQCDYCGSQVLPLADSTTGRRPFPHNTNSGNLCIYGTLVDDTALTVEVTSNLL